jgi:hypothetical protein
MDCTERASFGERTACPERSRMAASRADAGALAGMNFQKRLEKGNPFWRGRQNQHARRVCSPEGQWVLSALLASNRHASALGFRRYQPARKFFFEIAC